MVGRLSFWREGLFSGAMLALQGVTYNFRTVEHVVIGNTLSSKKTRCGGFRVKWLIRLELLETDLILGVESDWNLFQRVLCPLEPEKKDGGSNTGEVLASWPCFKMHFTLLPWRIIPLSKYLVTPIDKPFRPCGRGPTPPAKQTY